MSEWWREARSLLHLRDQINAAAPHRAKSSDGMKASDEHHAQNPNSDHEPRIKDGNIGVVTAFDITNDPAHGVVAREIAEAIIKSRDNRVKYIISNRQICSSKVSPWQWRPYDGRSPHTEHVHISVDAAKALYDDVRDWALPARLGPSPLPTAPTVTAPVPVPAPVFSAKGKGSWYSQFNGKYEWKDDGDKPNSNALGVPDSAQGVSFYNKATLGHWFEVRAPNGNISIEQQTDIGPHPRTGRSIDISAAAAERFGYSPHNFPTDGIFHWSSAPIPVEASLSPQQQATRFRDLRKISTPPVTVAVKPPVLPPPPDIAPPPIQPTQPAPAGFFSRLLRSLFG